MAKTVIPPTVDTQVHTGGVTGVIIANGGSSIMHLNTPAPSTAGGAIELQSGDSVAMEPGSPWAASAWWAWSDVGTVCVTTDI